MVRVTLQLFAGDHSQYSSQRFCPVGSPPGYNHLVVRRAGVQMEASCQHPGWLRDPGPRSAPVTFLASSPQIFNSKWSQIGASTFWYFLVGQSRAVFLWCDTAAQVQQCVAAGQLRHIGRTASTIGSMCQSCTAGPLTVWPAFLHHGCCGPYGGVDGRSQRLLRVHLSEIFLGQVPPRAPRPSSSARP